MHGHTPAAGPTKHSAVPSSCTDSRQESREVRRPHLGALLVRQLQQLPLLVAREARKHRVALQRRLPLPRVDDALRDAHQLLQRGGRVRRADLDDDRRQLHSTAGRWNGVTPPHADAH